MSSPETKTHYRKAFNSPYLSSADIVEPTVLTISRVELLSDKSKKTKDNFNTAFFIEKELRPGEELKPMILNAGNSRTMKKLTGSAFIEDWKDIAITVYVDSKVKFGRDMVEGLRISAEPPIRESVKEIDIGNFKAAVGDCKTMAELEKFNTDYEARILGAPNKDAVLNIIAEHKAVLHKAEKANDIS